MGGGERGITPDRSGASSAASFKPSVLPKAQGVKSQAQAQAEFAGLNCGRNCAVTADGKVWRVSGAGGTLDIAPNAAYHGFKEIFNTDASELAWDQLIDRAKDDFHETMKRLSQKYKFGYARMRRNGDK